MSAAGAPPPPPPPPPPPSPGANIEDLPTELLLMVYENLSLSSFMNLALAIYPALERHGLVPGLTPETVNRLEHGWRQRNNQSMTAVSRLPAEMWWQVAEYLEPIDLMRLILAIGGRFYNFPQGPDKVTIERLQTWARRSKK